MHEEVEKRRRRQTQRTTGEGGKGRKEHHGVRGRREKGRGKEWRVGRRGQPAVKAYQQGEGGGPRPRRGQGPRRMMGGETGRGGRRGPSRGERSQERVFCFLSQ